MAIYLKSQKPGSWKPNTGQKTDAMALTWANVIPEPNFVEMI